MASVLKYHGKMWYNFAVPHCAVPNFAPTNPPPPPVLELAAEASVGCTAVSLGKLSGS